MAKLRDNRSINAWGLNDEEPKNTVPVERPAQNGVYVGKCQVREVPPARYEPEVIRWGRFQKTDRVYAVDQLKTCARCKKEKRKGLFLHNQRSRENGWCKTCQIKHPDEWQIVVRESWKTGTASYRRILERSFKRRDK